jgi:hypothetical protein
VTKRCQRADQTAVTEVSSHMVACRTSVEWQRGHRSERVFAADGSGGVGSAAERRGPVDCRRAPTKFTNGDHHGREFASLLW